VEIAHIGPNIFHATWSSPSFGEVNGKPLIFFAGGDGVVRAFEPLTKSPPPGRGGEAEESVEFRSRSCGA
jgi:hypothetical protein